LDQYFHAEFLQALKLARVERRALPECERRVLGVDHAQIGAWLADTWSLPPAIVEAIRWHHQLELSQEHETLTAVVRLADLFTKALLEADQRASLHQELMGDPAWEILAKQNPEIITLDVVRFAEELEENMERAREFIRLASE
ncbi:MAG: HDOD domain-containing protein, partial [bacterium]|nr:HDOD domain-containing protein [bacterium]